MSHLKVGLGLVSAMLLISLCCAGQSPSVNLAHTFAAGSQVSNKIQQKQEEQAGPKDAPRILSQAEPVLTIHGVCASPGETSRTDAGACISVVTQEEFGELMEIVAPGRTAESAVRQKVATMYTQLLAFEAAAREAGISDTPEFRWTLQLLRLRALADSYRRDLERRFGTPSNEEIDGYYRRQVRSFEEVKLRRIVLPKNNFSAPNKEEFEKKVLQVANELRQRAGNGEDFDALQREGYATLGFPGAPPATEVGSRRRVALLAEIADEVFGLESGQVSRVENEPYSFVIYKVEAKRTLPEPMVRDEISREISRQKVENAIQAVTGSVHADLDEEYFGASGGHSHSAEPAARVPR